jgi:hypothetical protein
MHLTYREWWAVVHGMGLGALFLLAFAGGFAEFWSLRSGELSEKGIVTRTRRLEIGTWAMAAAAWATVITGTWVVYPWYRDLAPDSPRSLLLADPNTADWHEFGMEWKEHIGWAAPLLATAAAFLVSYYGPRLIARPWLRAVTIVMFVGAFAAAVVGGAFGAFLNKVAPIV